VAKLQPADFCGWSGDEVLFVAIAKVGTPAHSDLHRLSDTALIHFSRYVGIDLVVLSYWCSKLLGCWRRPLLVESMLTSASEGRVGVEQVFRARQPRPICRETREAPPTASPRHEMAASVLLEQRILGAFDLPAQMLQWDTNSSAV
jgi:hypothetical protein